jgi:hypothetical protein
MAIRQSRGITLGKGTPQRLEGQNGDITIRSSRKGLKLYVKESNKWHSINLNIDLLSVVSAINRLEKDVKKLSNKTNNVPVVDKVLLKQSGGSAAVGIKNDAGNIALGNGDANVTLESNGNYNLVLQTGNSDTGTITIADGLNQNVTIDPAGTGKVQVQSNVNLASGKKFQINGADLTASDVGGITASSTDTLTNKTFDANGTGNSLSNVDMANDVTGTLPAGNGGTGLTDISTLLNSNTTKGDVGLGNVDNTSDADKPISTAQATAINAKANSVNPSFTTSSGSFGVTAGSATDTLVITGASMTASQTGGSQLMHIEQTFNAPLVGAQTDHSLLKVNANTTGNGVQDFDNMYTISASENDTINFGVKHDGSIDKGSITSGFGAINNGSSSITTTGTISAGDFNHFIDVKIHQWYAADANQDYIPFGGSQAESNSTADSLNDDTLFIAPYNGTLEKIVLQAAPGSLTVGGAGNTRMQLRVNGSLLTYVQEAVANETSVTFTWSANNSFNAGDRLRISFDPTNIPKQVTATSVWKYTL